MGPAVSTVAMLIQESTAGSLMLPAGMMLALVTARFLPHFKVLTSHWTPLSR